MKKKRLITSSVFWGTVLVLAAVVLILDGLGIKFADGLFTPLRIIGGVLLLSWLIYEIVRLRFTNVFFPLAFLFLVMEEPIAALMGRTEDNRDLISNWLVLLAALLLTIGFKAIFRRSHIIEVNGHSVDVGGKKKLGTVEVYLDPNDVDNCKVCDNLGTVNVYVVNRDQYNGNGLISVSDNVGQVIIHLPEDWNVITQVSDNLGHVSIPPQTQNHEKSITLAVSDNLGQISVVFD